MTDPRIEEIRRLLPQGMLHDWVRLGSRLVRLLRDEHHPGRHDELLERFLARARESAGLRQWRHANVPPVSYPPDLPISARREEIVEAIRRHQVVIVAGETGSGKTTQLPKMCLEAGLGIEAMIGCTQPRRVAALSISRRISEELNVEWGREVGCKIRFDDHTSPESFIKLMTDGILLAETQGDPLLSEYNALIIDEAHERSLNIDFLLGCLRGLLVKRPELKLIITSATIDTDAFSRAFGNAPVIEISGRLYPVELRYAPLDPASEESGDQTYIDAAIAATLQALDQPGGGDILIFMPSERDIRETSDGLKQFCGGAAEIIPLFGRLSAGDQQRVFAPAVRRKIVVATNIAETSLTIPGIRFVIDSGLARLSRYNPRTRTRRLPIEPVSQSSARQRLGRAGRVREGVCVRLYSEADFESRPPFTQPEIQRANLAEVILRMKAFRLGEIETFPFLNPPAPAAIQAGYTLLQELGALDEARALTPLGRDLARLPIDPTLGRMLLQAQKEHAVRELLIIAAGLSIQDPRERPAGRENTAAAAHQRFADPQSDFLALLNLWNTVHEQWEGLRTQSQRRKFCQANFLSYLRMREWQDLHAQLHDALEELGTVRLNESNAAYEAIHRSILSGLLGHAANRVERNLYKGAGNRQMFIFPGSALNDRGEKTKPAARQKPPREAKPPAARQPDWVVAGEIVETSRLFARTVAAIDPLWILDLAPHLCRTTHGEPFWSVRDGRVLADEQTTLYGLEIRRRKVAYGSIDLPKATEVFIRSALVEEDLTPEPLQARREEDPGAMSPAQLLAAARAESRRPPPRFRFLEHNRQVRQKIETWQTRMRRHDLPDLDQALFDFYAARISGVSSLSELDKLLREHPEPGFLCATEQDLAAGRDLGFDAEAFPDKVRIGDHHVALSYAYSPGEEQDGVTVKMDVHLAQSLAPALVEWSVPGLREAQIAELLRSLPKSIRRQLMPLASKVPEILREFQPGGDSLKQALARFIHQRYGVEVPPSAWPVEALPPHLQPRVEVVGRDQKSVGVSRDLGALREQLTRVKVQPAGDPPEWIRLAQRVERFGILTWDLGDLPERFLVVETSAGPVYAWPGLKVEEGQVNLRLFHTAELAQAASDAGARRLLELALQKDLAWLQKDLRALVALAPLLGGLCSVEDLQQSAFHHLLAHLLPREIPARLTLPFFTAAVGEARARLPGLVPALTDRLEVLLKLRLEILRRCNPTPVTRPGPRTLSDLKQLGATPQPRPAGNPVAADLRAFFPAAFLDSFPYERLSDAARYLKAMLTRAERAALNPVKDAERARQIAPYAAALLQAQAAAKSPVARRRVDEFRWMVEEFKVSVFAQELGTAFPVSAKRLDAHLAAMRAE